KAESKVKQFPTAATATVEEYEDEDKTLFLIPHLIGVLRWFEELIVALSGWGIVFALGVSVIDLLTDGQLTQAWPWVDYAYAVCFAGAVAGQIVGCASRSSRSFNRGQWLRGLAYGALVALLAVTEYQAGIIFAENKAFGISVITALNNL